MGIAVFHRTVIAQNTWPVNRVGNPALALPIASDWNAAGEYPADRSAVG